MFRKKIKVQAESTYIDRIDEVVQGLKRAGMVVQDQFTLLGHFRGVADIDKIEQLKMVPGVTSVKIIGNEDEEERDDYSISSRE